MDKVNKVNMNSDTILEPCASNWESTKVKGDPVCNFGFKEICLLHIIIVQASIKLVNQSRWKRRKY
jgi:hypothetical protein